MHIGNFCYCFQFNNNLIKTHEICDILFRKWDPFIVNLKRFLFFEWYACLCEFSS